MICSFCGTESKEELCPHCGAVMRAAALAESTAPATASSEFKRKKRRPPPLRIKMVFWQAIALFLPLAYLFFDAFVLLSDSLFFSSISGNTHLHRLMERLGDPAYETNLVGEIAEATLGGSVTIFRPVSPLSLLSELTSGATELLPFLLPVAVTVLLTFLCAASGVFLLLTGGRILRVRAFCNLTLLGGMGATFAPLLGTLLLRVYYCFHGGIEAADMTMQRILPSLESLCIMGVLMCALLPSLASLRHLAAYAGRESDFVSFPYRFLTKVSFRSAKAVTILTMLAACALVACYFVLPITTLEYSGDIVAMVRTFKTDLNEVIDALGALAAGTGGGLDFTAIALLLSELANLLCVLLIALALAGVLLLLLRVLLLKKDRLIGKKGGRRVLKKVGPEIRNAVLVPYITFLIVQTILTLSILFASPVAMHLNLSNVNETLSLVYLVIAHSRTLGGVTTLYAFLAACGALLWYTAGQAASALSVQASNNDQDRSKSA